MTRDDRAPQPIRVQLRRTKGWRMPPNTVRVARPSTWGNPFIVGHNAQVDSDGETANVLITPELAVLCYRDYLEFMFNRPSYGDHPDDVARYEARVEGLAKLRGKNLACWCPLEDANGNRVPCHADVLLEVANR